MFSKFIGCCFPSKGDKLVNDKIFETGNQDPTHEEDKIENKAKLGNVYTMMMNQEENGLMDEDNNSHAKPSEVSTNQNNQKQSKSVHSPLVKKKDMNSYATIILDRMKLYNETQDHELFKSKISNLIQAKTIVTAVEQEDKEESVRF